MTGTHSYDVFGNRRLQTGQPTIPPEIFLFAGQQFDPKARADAGGLYYLRARFYDPSIGRFLTPDPLQGSPLDPQSLNRYSYVQNNPVNRVDPTGLLSETATLPFLLTSVVPDWLQDLLNQISSCGTVAELFYFGVAALVFGTYYQQPIPAFLGAAPILVGLYVYQTSCVSQGNDSS